MPQSSALRAPARAAGAVAQPSPVAGPRSSKNPHAVSLPSTASSSSSSSCPLATTAAIRVRNCLCDEDEQEKWIPNRLLFGPVPSKEETMEAISTLKLVFSRFASSCCEEEDLVDKFGDIGESMRRASSAAAEPEWSDPRVQLVKLKAIESRGCGRVFEAFRLLHLDPSVERMVISLSSDEAVWNTVMNNKVVQELRESLSTDTLHAAKAGGTQKSNEPPDIAGEILRWIYASTKAKIMEIVGNIINLITELFHLQAKEKHVDILHDVVRSSLMLSVMVFFLVIVTRLQRS